MVKDGVMGVARDQSYHLINFIVFVIVILSKYFFVRLLKIELGIKCKIDDFVN